MMWSRCDEVIALTASKLQEVLSHNAAHRVRPAIVFIGVAFPVAIPARHGVAGTGVEGLAENI